MECGSYMFIYVYEYNMQIERNYLGRGGRQTGGKGQERVIGNEKVKVHIST